MLSLSDLFPDNGGKSLALCQQVDIFQHQAFGLLEWFTPVNPIRLICGRQFFPDGFSQDFIKTYRK